MAACGILLSCEHGGYDIPPAYQHLFERQEDVLKTHRGWDPATLELSRYWAEKLSLPLVYSTISRLLIEMNRSSWSEELFSAYSRKLPVSEKEQLIREYYLPYRTAIRQHIDSYLQRQRVCLHFSVHSFTPVWEGSERKVDIGLLFDPERKRERSLCALIQHQLEASLPGLKICYNEPYLGTDDGLTTFLRSQYGDAHYAGIEIEINQKWVGSQQMLQIRNAWKEILMKLGDRQ